MNPAAVGRLFAAVDARSAESIEFLRTIVRAPSVTGDEETVQRIVASQMAAHDLEVDLWEPSTAELAPHALAVGTFATLAGRPNVVGVFHGAGRGRSLILNAHIDVVEAGDPLRWSHPPYAAEIVDGQLIGRGACDMKAGLAVNIFALRAVRDAGLAAGGDVIVQSVIGEEDGGVGTVAAILRGYRADAAIISEPTAGTVIAAHCGSLVFRLHVEGKAAHGATRDQGVSAIEKFSYLHRALLAFESRRNRDITHPLLASLTNKVPISIGVVHAGTWPSTVAEALVAEGRAGLAPGETLAGFQRDFLGVIDEAAAADPWLRDHRPVVEWFSGQFEPAEVPVDSPLVQLVVESHRAVHNLPPPVDGAPYGADMRHFVNLAHMPCIMYGPGDVRAAHQSDESVALADVVNVTKVIALAIARWCGEEMGDRSA